MTAAELNTTLFDIRESVGSCTFLMPSAPGRDRQDGRRRRFAELRATD